MKETKDEIIGKKFGRLTVLYETDPIYRTDKPNWKRRVYRCICDCGNEINVLRDSLVSQNTKSCGCLPRESHEARHKTHGQTETRLYRTWCHMKERCNNPNNNRYYRYGARGIKVCEEWESSFENFYQWAIENGYNDNLTIERKNNKRNYCPENCTWIPLSEQAKNKGDGYDD